MENLPGSPSGSLVAFLLDEQRYALRLESVERIFHVVEITPLPEAPETVLGVVNVWGAVVPVFDLRRRFRLPERKRSLTDQMILASTARRTVTLVVDHVLGIIDHPVGQAVSSDSILPRLDYVAGVVKLPDGLVLIHDLNTFLSLDEEAALERAISTSEPTNL